MEMSTVWSTLGIEKEEFDWMQSFINSKISEKPTQSQLMIELIKELRRRDLDDDSNSNPSQYEIKVLLLGKRLEQMIQDGILKREGNDPDDILGKIKRDLGIE